MDTKTLYREVREKIKALSVDQRKNKLARRTKRIDPELRKKYLLELGFSADESAGMIGCAVLNRRALITAHLNFLHELRNEPPCHGVRKGLEWEYEKALKELRGKLVTA